LREGDRQAFELLFERYADRVTGFVTRLAGSRSECEDIVQEVFVAAYTGRKSFAGRSQPLAWLLGIAVRRCRDHNRKRPTPITDDGEVDEIAGAPQCDRSLEDLVIDRVTMTDALRHLQPLFREALLLVASQGLTYREAAEAMGEPIGTVKWRASVAAAQMRLRLSLSEEEADGLPQVRV